MSELTLRMKRLTRMTREASRRGVQLFLSDMDKLWTLTNAPEDMLAAKWTLKQECGGVYIGGCFVRPGSKMNRPKPDVHAYNRADILAAHELLFAFYKDFLENIKTDHAIGFVVDNAPSISEKSAIAGIEIDALGEAHVTDYWRKPESYVDYLYLWYDLTEKRIKEKRNA